MERIQINFQELEKPHWTNEERSNAEIAINFIQKLMNDHNFEYIRNSFGNHPYKQHNQSMTDGIGGVLKVVSDFVKRYPEYSYDVKHLYVDGDYVTVHSHATSKIKHRGNPQKGLNIMDIWKIKDGQIIEHWDAVQPIHSSMRFLFWMIGGKFRNQNTYF